MELNEKQMKMCEESQWDFSDLRALILNCTLKRSPEKSHTEGLITISKTIMEKNGISVELLRPIDYDIATGVYPDMTEHGWDKDDWPMIYEKVEASDILILGSAIWLGEKTSVCTQVIEILLTKSYIPHPVGQPFKTGHDTVTRFVDAVIRIITEEKIKLRWFLVHAHVVVKLGHGELVLIGEENAFGGGFVWFVHL